MSFFSSLFGTSASPIVTSLTPAVQVGNDYAKAMKAKDAAAITSLFTAKAHIENNNIESVLIPDECFQGGAAWADVANKVTVERVMVGSGSDASEACVVMIMRDPSDATKAMWSMHILKVEQVDNKYQIVGMKVVEALGYGK